MTALILISFILFLGYGILIVYYRQGWTQLSVFDRSRQVSIPSTTVTVIIPARNEEGQISQCLTSVLAQSYPAHLFEVIVVDDHSTDDTAAIVKTFLGEHLQLIELKDHLNGPINSYKKKAIELAIAEAKGKLIVTTDADCIVPSNWLYTICSFYETHQPAFIAAPVFIPAEKSFLSVFQSLDFLTLMGITGAALHHQLHVMCNGANLAYEKSAFEKVDGFSGINDIASGDDMLLMQKINRQFPQRTMFLKSAEAIVSTRPAPSLSAFFNQRIRWASKSNHYQDKKILPILIWVYLFNLMLLTLPVIACFQWAIPGWFMFPIWMYWLLLLLSKTIIELFFIFPVASFFRHREILWWFPLMQPFHILYTVIAGFLGIFGSYTWKDRKVN